jgi:hypothetical protein
VFVLTINTIERLFDVCQNLGWGGPPWSNFNTVSIKTFHYVATIPKNRNEIVELGRNRAGH